MFAGSHCSLHQDEQNGNQKGNPDPSGKVLGKCSSMC